MGVYLERTFGKVDVLISQMESLDLDVAYLRQARDGATFLRDQMKRTWAAMEMLAFATNLAEQQLLEAVGVSEYMRGAPHGDMSDL